MRLGNEFDALATELRGIGWKTKPEVDWNDDERAAYQAWATDQFASIQQKRKDRGPAGIRFTVLTYEQGEEERRTRIGEYLRPFSLDFDRWQE